MFSRAFCLMATLFMAGTAPPAGATCPVPPYAPRATSDIKDWYNAYVRPFAAAGVTADSLTMEQFDALVAKQGAFNRRSTRDPLFFEALVQQVAQHYTRAPDFKGLDRETVKKLYRSGSGPDLDFSMACVDTRNTGAPDDTFAVTLFGITNDDCQHIGLRGLVFSDTLVNGTANGQCRPDHVYYHMLIFAINAGTNTVTYVCRKESNGCARQ